MRVDTADGRPALAAARMPGSQVWKRTRGGDTQENIPLGKILRGHGRISGSRSCYRSVFAVVVVELNPIYVVNDEHQLEISKSEWEANVPSISRKAQEEAPASWMFVSS